MVHTSGLSVTSRWSQFAQLHPVNQTESLVEGTKAMHLLRAHTVLNQKHSATWIARYTVDIPVIPSYEHLLAECYRTRPGLTPVS